MNATWSIVATVHENADVVRNFVAHHLILGADEIILYFDDPEDPVMEDVASLERVTTVSCDSFHWKNARPSTHQARQKHNANHAYRVAKTDWITHIDADELITATGSIARILARSNPETHVLRLLPVEAFAHPRDSVTTVFRRALSNDRRGRRVGLEAYGEEYPLLNRGLLSHVAGKFFVRTNIEGMVLSIHAPWISSARAEGQIQEDMLLLHLHGNSEDEWLSKVHHRMKSGAYQAAFHDARKRPEKVDGRALNAHLQHLFDVGGEDGLRAFFRRVSTFNRSKRKLRRHGLLVKKRLWSAEKVAAVFGQTSHVSNLKPRDDTGELEGDIVLGNVAMRLGLEENYSEIRLGQGAPDEEAEMATICDLVRDRSVDFYDIGANVGLYSLIVADAASPDSTIIAFEPNPRMADKFERNCALNPHLKVTLHRCALGEKEGEAQLSAPGNPGQATILPAAQGTGSFTVPLRPLKSFVTPAIKPRVSVFKVDIEGAEPLCLAPFFEEADRALWPDYILYEHAHTDVWPIPPEEVFPPEVYEIRQIFETNTLLQQKSPSAP